MKKSFVMIGVAGALLLTAGTAYAVTASDSTTVTATVPAAISVTAPASHVLSVTPGVETTTSLDIDVKSNTTWSMSVYKDDDLKDGAAVIPSARLLYTSSSAAGAGTAVDTQFATSGTPTAVLTGASKTGEAGATVTVDYKLTANYDDDPGEYTATHTYVAVAP